MKHVKLPVLILLFQEISTLYADNIIECPFHCRLASNGFTSKCSLKAFWKIFCNLLTTQYQVFQLKADLRDVKLRNSYFIFEYY